MDNIRFERQKDLRLRLPAKASVIGVGGIGAWVAIDLALSGTQQLVLFDDDQLEYSNLNRLPFKPSDVGRPKTEVVSEFITERNPDVEVLCIGNFTEITQDFAEGIVVDFTDKLAVQKQVFTYCKRKRIQYHRVGYDGNHITIIDAAHPDAPDPTAVWDDGSGRDGYTVVSSWAVPPQIASAMLVHNLAYRERLGPHKPITCHLNELMK